VDLRNTQNRALLLEPVSKMRGNPIRHFESWFRAAQRAGEKHPDAMTLATASKKGAPSARIVLYKGISEGRFKIFTNFESRKGKELRSNPRAALCFHWKALDRQVRIEGRIRVMPRQDAVKYFHSRPRQSQIGAWASHQSQVIPSRRYLLQRARHFEKQFEGQAIPMPSYWGGFLLVPERIEFWVDGKFRLHDRFVFEKTGRSPEWKVRRLSP